jgi:hypothetical protein
MISFLRGISVSFFKQFLVNRYNNIYDLKLDFELFLRWKKDLKIQRDYGIPKILSVDETLDKIITEKLSVCRYGDGEFKIMDGDSIQFQGESSDLAQRLKKVVKSNRDDVLVCLPSFFDRRHKKLETVITLSKEEKKKGKN